ncbi:helix-turn-helix domain-containing protein [Leptospira stimsonii]|uniref:helix-turn-helix domain-containing protein n=1 Tax=Leptospira stimsonii TaxID=2202203 RepID=UPI003CCFEF45
MKLKLLHPTGFYFFSFFILNILVWMFLEGVELLTEQDFSLTLAKYVEYFEIWIGLLTLFGIYFIASEAKRFQIEIQESRELVQNLRHQFLLSSKDWEQFWKEILNQFHRWKYTKTEMEIASCLLRGLSNQQIASIRNTSLRTVETQTSAIYQKSGMRGKLDFIAYFIMPLLPEED